jgi:hypothetical protein
MFQLDHVIVAVPDLGQACDQYRQCGFTVIPGGKHGNGATENALIVFADGSYIELLAPTGKPPQNDSADYSFLLAHGAGLVGFALRSEDLHLDREAMQGRGLTLGTVQVGARRRPDGKLLEWETFRVHEYGLSPFFIQDRTPRSERVPQAIGAVTHANSAIGIGMLTLEYTAETLHKAVILYSAMAGVPPYIHESHMHYGISAMHEQFGLTLRLGQPPAVPPTFGDVPVDVVLKFADYHQAQQIIDHGGYAALKLVRL